jgi:hypothetical protein
VSASELRAILLSIVQKLDDLQVNQDVLPYMSKPGHTLGEILDIKRAAEIKAKDELAELRKQIEELA